MIGDIAHVCNRGVDKRKIFMRENDYLRFVQNLLCLNNEKGRIRIRRKKLFVDVGEILAQRNELVDILQWNLLPNHYHLLLHEKVEGGILEFTKRIGNAYTKYFNIKHGSRSGYLFQNSAKIVRIDDHRQFLYIPLYIDLNAADLFDYDWKNHPHNSSRILKFLYLYRWSSLRNYQGHLEFKEIVNTNLFYELFDFDKKKYEKELLSFLKESAGRELADVAGRPIPYSELKS